MIGRDGGYTTRIGGEILWGFGDTLFYGSGGRRVLLSHQLRRAQRPRLLPPRRTPRLVGRHGGTARASSREARSPTTRRARPSTTHGRRGASPSRAETQRSSSASPRRPVRDQGPRRRHRHRCPRRHQSNPCEHLALHAERMPLAPARTRRTATSTSSRSSAARPALVAASQRLPAHGIARAPKAEMTDRSSYRFWNGTSWTTDQTQTTTILAGVPGHLSMAWNEHLGKFLTIYGSVRKTSFYTTADQPEGPGPPSRSSTPAAPARTTSGSSTRRSPAPTTTSSSSAISTPPAS